jgi:ribonuclease E
VKTEESMSIEVIRLLMLAGQHPSIKRVDIAVNDKVATYLNNKKRRELAVMEEQGDMTVQILGREDSYPEYLDLRCRDASGSDVKLPV